jgi:hypothetical protein
MIAALTFIIAGFAAYWHFMALGWKVGAGFTVWTAWFCAVLIASGVDAWRSKDDEIRAAWLVMAVAWLASMLTWKISPNPLIDLTLKNLAVMAALLMIARRPETGVSAMLHGVVVLCAYLATQGVIPTAAQRPKVFIAWSYPDIAAALQHLSLMVIGGYGYLRSAFLDTGDNRGHMPLGGSVASHARKA